MDAKKIAELERHSNSHPPLCMLANKPLNTIWAIDAETPTGYLIFGDDQNIQEIEQILQKLVQHK
jgi:hypothetical protein